MKKHKTGITLISLIVTIIVLLILAGVSINTVFSDSGIIKKAQEAQNKMNEAVQNDMEGINEITNLLDSYINGIDSSTDPDEDLDEDPDEEKISTEESYVGYYADVDEDGTVDGVIYADLLIGGSGTWNPAGNTYEYATTGGTYNIDKISSAKNYTISQESYEGKFGTQPVLKAIDKSGNDRFYVMALSNLDNDIHYWYYSANGKMTDYAEATSIDFGTGKANTETMIKKWNNTAYGKQSGNDIWGLIKNQVSNGWFVPSANEWAAFGSAFNITSSNYSELYGLDDWYWSSSQYNSYTAYIVKFVDGRMGYSAGVEFLNYIRLSTIF